LHALGDPAELGQVGQQSGVEGASGVQIVPNPGSFVRDEAIPTSTRGAAPLNPQPNETPPLPGTVQWRLARRCLLLLGALWAISTIGRAFSLYLINHHPLVLVAMSPMGSHVLLATAVTNPIALLAVTTARRLVFYAATFFLGRALGPYAIQWVEARARHFGRFVRLLERLFARAPRLVVVGAAGPTVSALAGMSGMSLSTYLTLAAIGLVVRLWIWIQFADIFRGPIEQLLTWIEEYWVPGTIVLVAILGVTQWRRLRAARAARGDLRELV
jgi:membrane protein DedA with SNARE-associated domain